jgi:N4-gp56 family major capsid protein
MAFTSVANRSGNWPDNAVQAAYDTLFGYAFKASAMLEPFVDKQPERPTSPGSSVTLYKNQFFAESAILASTTPLNEEADVTAQSLPASVGVTLTPTEYGAAVAATEKLQGRTLTPVNPVMARLVGVYAKDVIDRLVEIELRTGTNKIRGGGKAADNLLTVTDTAKATHIRQAVTKLRGASVPTRDGRFYAGIFHPDQIHDLREETGSGSWRVPNEYGASQEQIWNGEFGEFEGVRFVSNPKSLWAADKDAGASSVSVYHGYILGREALAKAVVTPLQTVVTPVVDKLKRFYGLGWKCDLDYGLYRDESLWQVITGSSLG